MGKTQILSVLGLALALGVLGGNYVFAEDDTATTAVAAMERSAGEANNLTNAINNAQKVLDDTKNVNYTEYPGVRKYLQGLVDESKKSNVENPQALADALNEGALAASLLMGTYNNTDAKVAEPVAYTDSAVTYAVKSEQVIVSAETEEAAQSEESVSTAQLANTSVKVTVAASMEAEAQTATPSEPEAQKETSESDEVAVEDKNSLKNENADEIEVPKTGEKENNLGVLIVAGVGVVAATLGATAAILRSKKNA